MMAVPGDFKLTPEPVCGEFVKALEECHARGMLASSTGACEPAAHALNMCLRRERLERQSHHFKEASEKRKAVEKRWKEMEEEEFGPGGKLKKVLAVATEGQR